MEIEGISAPSLNLYWWIRFYGGGQGILPPSLLLPLVQNNPSAPKQFNRILLAQERLNRKIELSSIDRVCIPPIDSGVSLP